MPRLHFTFLFFVLLLAVAGPPAEASGTSAQRGIAKHRVPHQVVVRYAPDATSAQRTAARASVKAELGRRLGLAQSELLVLPQDVHVPQAVRTLERNPAVRYAEANAYAQLASTCPATLVNGAQCVPNDPRMPEQYDLDNRGQTVSGSTGSAFDADIDAVEAWNITRGSNDVVVAVVDSGIAYDNPDLAPNMWTNAREQGTDGAGRDKRSNGVDDDSNGHVDDWRGWDVVGRSVIDPADSDNDPRDISGHGTHVAGTLGARAHNGKGVAGLNWNVRIMNVRVRAERSNETSADIADAFIYAARNGARIVNVSLSERDYSQYLQDAINAFPGVLFVVAAGNDGLDLDAPGNDRWPCEYPSANLICVGATGRADELASWSNRGPQHVDIAAPGVLLTGTQPAYVQLHSENFETDPFAAPERYFRGTNGGFANDWGLSTVNRRSGTYSLTNLATGKAQPGSDTYVELAKPFDLTGRTGCELRATIWVTTDAASGLYLQARGDRSFMAPSKTPAQDTPTPSTDTIAYYNGSRSRSGVRLNISDLDGRSTVYVRIGVLQSATSPTAAQAWIDDLQLHCVGSTYSTNGVAETAYMAGTSMATPHVAGVAAMMVAKDPSLSVGQLRGGLLRATDPLPVLTGRVATGGRLNAYKALAATRVSVNAGVLTVAAGVGQTNRFAVVLKDGAFRVTDAWTPLGQSPMAGSRLEPGAGCSRVHDTEVSCPTGGISSIAVETSDLQDTVVADSVGVPVTVDGEPYSRAPSAITDPASSVTESAATLNATVNAQGQATTYRFEWGTTSTYGQATAERDAGSDRTARAVTAGLTGLQAGTTYHYRIVATNGSGTTRGANRTFTTAGGPQPAYEAAVEADAPVAYWRLGEASGTVAADRMGSNTGAYAGTVSLGAVGAVAGNTAAAFAGSGSISVSDSAALRTADTFSFEAWVKLSRLNLTQGLASKGTTYLVYLDSANRLVLRKPNVGAVATAKAAIADTSRFHHVVVTKSGSVVRLYLDGADVTGTVTNRALVSSTAKLLLANGAAPLHGTLDEVALYGTALSAAQVATHFKAAATPGEPPPPPPPSAPEASTGAASVISDTGATLSATVNPKGQATTHRFEWGTDTTYGRATTVQDAGSSTTARTVTATLTGLHPRTTYHYRVVATNATGATAGEDRAFTTASTPPPPPPSSYASVVLADGPAAYWRLGEPSGTRAGDELGASPGTLTGGATLGATGALAGDTALLLNGSGSVFVPDSPSLRTGDTFSFEAWVKLGRLNATQGLALKGTTYLIYLDSGNRLALRKPNVGAIALARTAIADMTRFHHLAVTKAGATVKLYLDGADVTGSVTNRTFVESTGGLELGVGAGALTGSLDEVAIYGKALTAAQVANHFAAASR